MSNSSDFGNKHEVRERVVAYADTRTDDEHLWARLRAKITDDPLPHLLISDETKDDHIAAITDSLDIEIDTIRSGPEPTSKGYRTLLAALEDTGIAEESEDAESDAHDDAERELMADGGTSPYDRGYDGDHASRQSEESDTTKPDPYCPVCEETHIDPDEVEAHISSSDTPIADGGRVSEESDDEPPTRGIEMMEDAEVVR